MTTPITLVYFTATGAFYDVESADPSGSTSALDYENMTGGYITFYPRIPSGMVSYIANLTAPDAVARAAALALAPINGRIMGGLLCTINSVDTPGVQLVSSSQAFDLNGPLIYDVAFTQVTYNSAVQHIANFAFPAPYDATGVDITSPTLARSPYGGP